MTSAQDVFRRGVDAYAQGDHEAATAAFEAYLAQRPRSTAALCNLAGVRGSRGDYAGAVEAYDRALAVDPQLTEALAGLAWALPMSGGDERMPELVQRWSSLAPDDPVAKHLAASLGLRPAAGRCEDEYIERFFDGFASTYDDTLHELTYRAPQQIHGLLGSIAGPAAARFDILDAGCGTGLCGAEIHAFARTLTGIDLSQEMLEHARQRCIYSELVHSDLVAGMAARAASADVVVSADVLVYFGDLEPPFAAAAQALRPGGWLLASVELTEATPRYELATTGRYVHAEAYVRATLDETGFVPERATTVNLRLDRGQPVPGLVFAGRLRL